MCHECVLTLGLEADGLTSDLANNAQPPPSEPNGDAYNAGELSTLAHVLHVVDYCFTFTVLIFSDPV